MIGLLQALMPKEDRFFGLFCAHSRIILAGATDLRALLDGGDEVPKHCAAILEHELAADAITRDVLQSVRRTFITPFDSSPADTTTRTTQHRADLTH